MTALKVPGLINVSPVLREDSPPMNHLIMKRTDRYLNEIMVLLRRGRCGGWKNRHFKTTISASLQSRVEASCPYTQNWKTGEMGSEPWLMMTDTMLLPQFPQLCGHRGIAGKAGEGRPPRTRFPLPQATACVLSVAINPMKMQIDKVF